MLSKSFNIKAVFTKQKINIALNIIAFQNCLHNIQYNNFKYSWNNFSDLRVNCALVFSSVMLRYK